MNVHVGDPLSECQRLRLLKCTGHGGSSNFLHYKADHNIVVVVVVEVVSAQRTKINPKQNKKIENEHFDNCSTFNRAPQNRELG